MTDRFVMKIAWNSRKNNMEVALLLPGVSYLMAPSNVAGFPAMNKSKTSEEEVHGIMMRKVRNR